MEQEQTSDQTTSNQNQTASPVAVPQTPGTEDQNKKKSNKTLIIVIVLIVFFALIAPIGIIAAMTLTSLGSARDKAADARVKGYVSSLRGEAQIYQVDHNETFIGLSSDPKIKKYSDDIKALGSELKIQGLSNSTFVIYAQLPTAKTIWCVDATGFAGEIKIISPSQKNCQ